MVKKEPGLLVIDETSVAASSSTSYDLSEAFLKKALELAITCRVTFHGSATDGITLKILASGDNSNFDTDNLTSFEPTFAAGATAQKTILLDAVPQYLRITVTNDDTARAISTLKVWVTRVNRYG